MKSTRRTIILIGLAIVLLSPSVPPVSGNPIDLPPLRTVLDGQLALPAADGIVSTLLVDEGRGYAYLGTDSAPAHVVRVRLSDFTRAVTKGRYLACRRLLSG